MEVRERRVKIDKVQSDLNYLIDQLNGFDDTEAPPSSTPPSSTTSSPIATRTPTLSTLPPDISDLLRHQQKAIAMQDEVQMKELLASAQRQKEIVLAINAELKQQNSMLDDTRGNVEDTTKKLAKGQRRVKKI